LNQKQLDLLDAWFRSLLWEAEVPDSSNESDGQGSADAKKSPTIDVHRLKGRIITEEGKISLVQGVREVFDIFDAPDQKDTGQGVGKLVLIGRGLKDVDLKGSLEKMLSRGTT
jgi:Cobalamin synthesis protein cobW C-terminal domain